MDAVRWLELRVKDDPDKLSDRRVFASPVFNLSLSNGNVSINPRNTATTQSECNACCPAVSDSIDPRCKHGLLLLLSSLQTCFVIQVLQLNLTTADAHSHKANGSVACAMQRHRQGAVLRFDALQLAARAAPAQIPARQSRENGAPHIR